jgi:predicted membrane metal-binding protein
MITCSRLISHDNSAPPTALCVYIIGNAHQYCKLIGVEPSAERVVVHCLLSLVIKLLDWNLFGHERLLCKYTALWRTELRGENILNGLLRGVSL